MERANTLLLLIIIAIAGSLVVIYAAVFIIEQAQLDSNSSVPIYAGIIAFLAAIVSAIFQEVSARYKEKRARADKIWELVFPIMKDGYIPWIEHAKKLSKALNQAKESKYDDFSIDKVLYFMCLFYGLRFRFLLKYGGTILLSKRSDEIEVDEAYQEIKKALIWAGNDTEKHITELMEYFMKKQNLTLNRFIGMSHEINPELDLKEERKRLKAWLEADEKNVRQACDKLNRFAELFEMKLLELSGRDDK